MNSERLTQHSYLEESLNEELSTLGWTLRGCLNLCGKTRLNEGSTIPQAGCPELYNTGRQAELKQAWVRLPLSVVDVDVRSSCH